jgi:hypothetical protein
MRGTRSARAGVEISEARVSTADTGDHLEALAAYIQLKFESARIAYSVARHETQGRIHTSTCKIAVLPGPSVDHIDIDPADLRTEYPSRIGLAAAGRDGSRAHHAHSDGIRRECRTTLATQEPRLGDVAPAIALLAAERTTRRTPAPPNRKRLVGTVIDRSNPLITSAGARHRPRINLTLPPPRSSMAT